MIATSQKWKDYSSEIGVFHIKAVIDNGTSMNLTDADFMQGSVSITDSVSGMSEFTVGAVITNTFNGTLNNFDGKFNNYTLAGARLTVQLGIIYEDTTEEWIDKGVYTLEKPTSLGSTIKVVGYDDMDKLNKYYIGKDANFNDITFPLDSDELAEILCDYCGVTFGSWNLYADSVDEFEYDESTTCRQVLSWLVQSFGGYARINTDGELDCKAFNLSTSPQMTLSKIKSLDVYVEDITVTGVRAFAYNTVDEFEFDTVGSSGYILVIQDNPLVTDNTLAVATRVYNKVNGLTFRPFDASIFGDPSIEAGDVVELEDYLGNTHISTITSLTYNLNQAERLECNAKTPEEADLETANPQTSVIKGAVTAAYDYILAKKIRAEAIEAGTLGVNGTITTNDLEVLNGSKLGGFNIADNQLEATYTIPHTYTSADTDRLQDIILGNITPTQEDYDLLDVTGDGYFDILDLAIIRKAVLQNDGILSTQIHISPESYTGIVSTGGTKIGASAVISADGVFSNLRVQGERVNDFIIGSLNQGTSWRWTKYNSGKVEMWLRKSFSVNVNQAYGAMYFGHVQPDSYPTASNAPRFIETPSVVASAESGNGGDIFIGLDYGSASSPPRVCCYCAAVYSGSVTLDIHVIGKWK